MKRGKLNGGNSIRTSGNPSSPNANAIATLKQSALLRLACLLALLLDLIQESLVRKGLHAALPALRSRRYRWRRSEREELRAVGAWEAMRSARNEVIRVNALNMRPYVSMPARDCGGVANVASSQRAPAAGVVGKFPSKNSRTVYVTFDDLRSEVLEDADDRLVKVKRVMLPIRPEFANIRVHTTYGKKYRQIQLAGVLLMFFIYNSDEHG